MDTASLFKLHTPTHSFEVTQFTLRDWAVSREYTIDLTLKTQSDPPKITTPACLDVDNQYFHGIIVFSSINHANVQHLTHARLVSPLAYFLHASQTRIHNHTSAKTLLHTLLQEHGLLPEIQFKLDFRDTNHPLWFPQHNESTLLCFQRILASLSLHYQYKQSREQAICIISNSPAVLLPSQPAHINVIPSKGLYHNQPTTLAAHHQLFPRTHSTRQFMPETGECASSTKHSHHAHTQGHVIMYDTDEALVRAQLALEEEQSSQLQLQLTQLALEPGQSVTLQGSVLKTPPQHVVSISLTGTHIETQDTHNHQLKSMPRLQLNATLAKHHGGFSPSLQHNLHRTIPQLQLAHIEQECSQSPCLSSQGKYRTRLHQDEPPHMEHALQSSPTAQLSPWVRHALYYSGNHYGLQLPLHKNSEVLIGFENNHPQKPVILGALFNTAPLIAHENPTDNLLNSNAGHQLAFGGNPSSSFITLSTPTTKNQLTLTQNQSSSEFKFNATQGKVVVKSLQPMTFSTGTQHIHTTAKDHLVYTQSQLTHKSQEGRVHLDARESVHLHSQREISIKAPTQTWASKSSVRLDAAHRIQLDSKQGLTFQSERAELIWHAAEGKIHFTARSKLSLRGGSAILQFTPTQISLSTPGQLTLSTAILSGLEQALPP